MRHAKFALITLLSFALFFTLTGCEEEEQIEPDKSIPVMQPMNGNILSFPHALNGDETEIRTTYDLGSYKLENWRITDTKAVNMTVSVEKQPAGQNLLLEHVHADVAIKATAAQLNGLSQDTMDNQYHGTSQDGFLINTTYSYKNTFLIEGFSKDLIDGWSFYAGDYGAGSIESTRLTEGNLANRGAFGSEISVVYNFIVKNKGESQYHIETVTDHFIVPTKMAVDLQNQAKKEQDQ